MPKPPSSLESLLGLDDEDLRTYIAENPQLVRSIGTYIQQVCAAYMILFPSKPALSLSAAKSTRGLRRGKPWVLPDPKVPELDDTNPSVFVGKRRPGKKAKKTAAKKAKSKKLSKAARERWKAAKAAGRNSLKNPPKKKKAKKARKTKKRVAKVHRRNPPDPIS